MVLKSIPEEIPVVNRIHRIVFSDVRISLKNDRVFRVYRAAQDLTTYIKSRLDARACTLYREQVAQQEAPEKYNAGRANLDESLVITGNPRTADKQGSSKTARHV